MAPTCVQTRVDPLLKNRTSEVNTSELQAPTKEKEIRWHLLWIQFNSLVYLLNCQTCELCLNTPARTLFISELKSRVFKLPFLLKNNGKKQRPDQYTYQVSVYLPSISILIIIISILILKYWYWYFLFQKCTEILILQYYFSHQYQYFFYLFLKIS